MNEPADTDPATVLLASIHPATPPPHLMERLLAAFPAPPAVNERPKRFLFLPRLATAAAVMAAGGIGVWYAFPGSASHEVVSVPGEESKSLTPGSPLPAPKHIRRQLLGMRDLGIARDALSRPIRLMHARWLDTETGEEGPNAAPARATRVRDEIVPVVLTTY